MLMLDQGTFVTTCREENRCHGLFASLIDVFTKETVIYRELKNFMIDEKQMLLKSASLLQLNENNAVKENIILKARLLEEVRASIMKRIARELDYDPDSATLASLTDYAGDDQQRKLETLKNELTEIARDISVANEANASLLETSMNHVRGSIDFMSSLISQSGVYSGNGKMDLIPGNGKILRTEG